MHDYNYKSLLINLSFRELDPKISNDSIRPVVTSFVRNLNRVVSLAKMPPTLMDYATWLGIYASIAYHKETGDYLPDNEIVDKELADKIHTLSTIFMKKLIGREKGDQGLHSRTAWERGNANLEVLDTHLEGAISRAVEAVLFSVVIGAWTAFETLVADLWEACLNARPRLGFVALDAEPTSTDDDAELDRKRRIKFSIPVRLLNKWNYDLKNRMGSVLREKWDFARRDLAADAYYKTFGKNDNKLKNILEDINLRWLAAIRNVIIHKAGVADAEFVKLVVKHPILCLIKETEQVNLNGNLVRDLVDVAATRGAELITFIDEWLSANKE